MELEKLFQAQEELDQKINENKGLQDVDLLDKKILALQVELGELANEWRGFKFWSKDQEPTKTKNIYRECGWCDGDGREPGSFDENCHECGGEGDLGVLRTEYPLLEEYVDCLHFILSIGNDLKSNSTLDEYEEFIECGNIDEINIVQRLIWINNIACNVENHLPWHIDRLLFEFLYLGQQLGFTWEQIEQAYFEKNKINHERQESGY